MQSSTRLRARDAGAAAAAGPSHPPLRRLAVCRRRQGPLPAAASAREDVAASSDSDGQQQAAPAAFSGGLASRRAAMSLLAQGAALLAAAPPALAAAASKPAGDWSSPGLAVPVDPSQPKFFKTDRGVKVQVLAEGAGPAAAAGDSVLVDFVLRRSNGYFIYGTVEGVSFQPKDVPVGPVALRLGDGSTLPGLEDVLLGARPGSKFRALVPPELGYYSAPGAAPQMPTFATQRQLQNHQSEALLFEVQLLRVAGVKQR